MNDTENLLPILKNMADEEFLRVEPEGGLDSEWVEYISQRLIWMMKYSGAPQMEEFLKTQAYIDRPIEMYFAIQQETQNGETTG